MRRGSDARERMLVRVDRYPAAAAHAQPARARTMSRPRRRTVRPSSAPTMVRGMVERLAERLKSDGSDVEGWLRLVRAYMVLGDPSRRAAAAGDARRALDGRAGQAATARRTGQRARPRRLDRRLNVMTRKQRRLVLIGVEPRRARARGRAGAERAQGLDRVLQLADRRGRERSRARHAASGSAAWSSPARWSAATICRALRGDRRQERDPGRYRASCRICSAKGRA